jgi:hypothetical protein
MEGLINRSLESFLRSSYGDALWQDVVLRAGIGPRELLALTGPQLHVARRLVIAAARQLEKSPGEVLEDMGGWLVRLEPIRRLLRFSGPDFSEFVLSLDELPGRARLILPDLAVPDVTVTRLGRGGFRIGSKRMGRGWIWALAGMLRGMADDYGTLALIMVAGNWITLSIVLEDHGAARPFALAPDDGAER